MRTNSRTLARLGMRAGLILVAIASGYILRSPTNAVSPGDAIPKRRAAISFRPETLATGEGSDEQHVFGPVIGDGKPGRMPGEFEEIDALLLGVNELIQYHPQMLVEIFAAIDGQTRIVALISKPEQEEQTLQLLRSRGLATDTVFFFMWPAESMWVQDFGPQMVVDDDVRVIDFEYGVPGREVENQLPMAFAATFGMKIAHCHLSMEGGSCLSNGRGLCISSTILIDQNQDRGHDMPAIGRLLNGYFGFKKWCYVQPIIGETTGHLDLFLSVGGPSTVFLASYDPEEDRENAERMDANVGVLAAIADDDGRPLEIIRVPQPTARDGCWRSYTNVIYANGVVIVPQFPDFSPELDREALAIYRRAFPERRIAGIDSSRIVAKRGGLHCLSLSIPRLPERRDSDFGRTFGARKSPGF